jgi:hypothetical protein
MSSSRRRLPSNEDLILVFGLCAFIIHLWAQHNLYNLAQDPEELEDLSKTQKSIASELRQELDHKLAEVNS